MAPGGRVLRTSLSQGRSAYLALRLTLLLFLFSLSSFLHIVSCCSVSSSLRRQFLCVGSQKCFIWRCFSKRKIVDCFILTETLRDIDNSYCIIRINLSYQSEILNFLLNFKVLYLFPIFYIYFQILFSITIVLWSF